MNWFEAFHAALRGEAAPSDLRGPRGAGPAEALAHYRRQYALRVRHAVEVTFPLTRELVGERWDGLLREFTADARPSPRSLDHHPALFVDFLALRVAPALACETARFEALLDAFPWSHPPLVPAPPPAMTERSKLVLGATLVFESTERVEGLPAGGALLIWSARDGARHRIFTPAEKGLWESLSRGDSLGDSLSGSELGGEQIQAFFSWLVSSGLLRAVC